MTLVPQGFIEAFFGAKPENLHILLWEPKRKRSFWSASVAGADRIVADHAGRDLYIGMGLSPEDYGPNLRCKADSVAAIAGLWADIDFQDPAHKKTNLPPDLEAALSLLDATPLAPSFIVHSGHGIQPHWLFAELWVFEDQADREKAATLVRNWQATLRGWAAKHGWDMDATHDLSRILRVPETTNTKSAPVPVHVIRSADVRYNPDDFSMYLVDESPYHTVDHGAVARIGKALTLDPDAFPPFDKWEALKANEPRSLQSFERKRRDMIDQSPSAYDMALADAAAAAAWSDQEICNLLVASRRFHGDDLKLGREDYYALTIAKAKAGGRYMEAIAQHVAETPGPVLDPDARQKLLDAISEYCQVRVVALIKYMTEPPEYFLTTERGKRHLSGISELDSQSLFRRAVMDAARVRPRLVKDAQWEKISQTLLDVLEEQSAGTEATDTGYIKEKVRAYLASYPPSKEPDTPEYPLVDDENVIHIFGAPFKRWLFSSTGENITDKRLGILLRKGGAENTRAHVSVRGKRTTRSSWRLLNGLVPHADDG